MINVYYSRIWELMLYEFELARLLQKWPKNICFTKGEVAVDHSTVIGVFQKFRPVFKDLDEDLEAVLHVIKINSGK